MHPYEEQLTRTRRWYARFKEINDGSSKIQQTETCLDDMHAFFVNCYQVKDYLRNDPAFTKHSDDEIESYISRTPALALCADVCNGLKHLKLKTLRSGAVPTLGGRVFEEGVGHNLSGEHPLPTSVIKLKIEHAGTTTDAFQLATDALAAWELFVV